MTSPEWLAADEDDSDRFPAPHTSAQISPHSPDEGLRVVPDPARVARWEFLVQNTADWWPRQKAEEAMRLADEERAALVAEVERLRAQMKAAERWAMSERRLTDEALKLRNAAEAKVAKVEALAEEWWNEAEYDERASADVSRAMHSMVGALRAVVSSDVCPHGRHWSGLDDQGCAQCRDLNLAVALASPPEPTDDDESCPYCDGRGIVDNADHRCGWCGGSGRTSAALADAPTAAEFARRHFADAPAEQRNCEHQPHFFRDSEGGHTKCLQCGTRLDAPAEQRAEGGA